jgi:hypothetical protein
VINRKAPSSGTSGTVLDELANIKNFSHLAQRLAPLISNALRSTFLPWSFAQPPTADPNATGNRVIAITSATQGRPKLTAAVVLPLQNMGGVAELIWSFAEVNFPAPPSVTATPEGPPPSAGTTVYVVSPVGTNEVIVKSSDNSDRRNVHLQAVQVSSGN